ncbi:serine/threonine-protein kinase Nek4-like isoform X2 [Ptychodera flava]|uniref:serine/threonine-protein kinase Nek4-like isoform X2 n=1 Tax=Ptychodera flava TaxID=63121 RepID=UPI00396AB088
MTSMNDYDKLRVVGKGSYGEVWLVKHKKDRKQYVLKRMDLQNASKRERKAAELEAKLLSKLKHPNIVSYKDSFETDDGFLYIAMGYCDGGDLYTKLKEQKTKALEEKQVVEWFVQIAMALQYMHERNILHRDLKTQNIFLTKSKIIKVGDLGIAKVLDGHNDMATTLIGTPYYMSPELFSNKPYNHKSDVWALGCCVYEMSTLKHAFNARDMNSLVYKILRGKMPAMPRMYSQELTDLIKAMLQQNPERRPSVSRILRNPFIKKHIAMFLEGTRQRRPSSSGQERRPSSGSGDRARPSSARSDIYELPPEQKKEISKPSVPGDEKLDISPELEAIPEVSTAKEREAAAKTNSQRAKQPLVEKPKSPKSVTPKVEPKRSAPSKTEQPRPAVEPSKGGVKVAVAKRKAKSARDPSGEAGSSGSAIPIEREMDVQDTEMSMPRSANRGRPLPPPPSKGETPTRSSSSAVKKSSYADSKDKVTSSSSSVSSSKEDLHTPSASMDQMRKSANSSARARRRLRESQEQGKTPRSLPGDGFTSAVVERRQASKSSTPTSSSTNVTDGPTPKSSKNQVHRVKSDPQTATEKKKVVIFESKEQQERHKDKEENEVVAEKAKNRINSQDSSSTDEEESDQKKGEEREEKEMKRFSKMLETTLKMEDIPNFDDKDSPDGPVASAPPSYSPPDPPEVKTDLKQLLAELPNKNNKSASSESDKFIEIEAAAPRAPKGIGNMSLTTCGRLMDRIAALRRDIIKGVGIDVLKTAYEIMEEVDGTDVEPRLTELMGKDKFDIFAGKIWQLKFCEETVFG